jgi:hypothetical protein
MIEAGIEGQFATSVLEAKYVLDTHNVHDRLSGLVFGNP